MQESKDRGELFIGVELIESGIRAVLISPEPKIVENRSFNGPSASVDLRTFVEDCSAEHGRIASAGLAFASGLESEGASVGADLFKLFGAKPVMESSANAGAVGESCLGAGRDSQNFFYVTLGTPVGGALMLNGGLWRGVTGHAGEFGSIVIDSDGKTVNDFATDESILRRTRNRFHQDHTSSLVGMDESEITVSDIVREALKEDEFALMMLERTGRFAGVAVGGVISLLNVDTVIVGGTIVGEGTSVLEGVAAGAAEHCHPTAFEAVKIVAAELGEFSAACGAAILASRQ